MYNETQELNWIIRNHHRSTSSVGWYLLNKLRCILYRFKYVAQCLEQNQKIILFQTLVEPHLIYGILGWGGISRTHLDALEISQRFLSKNSRYLSEQVYSETNVFRTAEYCSIPIKTYSTCTIRILLQENQFCPIANEQIDRAEMSSIIEPKSFNTLPDDKNTTTFVKIHKRIENVYISKEPERYKIPNWYGMVEFMKYLIENSMYITSTWAYCQEHWK